MHILNKLAAAILLLIISPLLTFAAFTELIQPEIQYRITALDYSEKNHISYSRIEKYGLPELALNRLSYYHGGSNINWEFQLVSTGDEIYRENFSSAMIGFKYQAFCFYLSIDAYYIYIKEFGSAMTPGMSLKADFKLTSEMALHGGVNGLITGRFRDAYRDIERFGWGGIYWRAADKTSLAVMLLLPEFGRSGINLTLEQELNSYLSCLFMLTDRPAKSGGGVTFHLKYLTLSLIFTHQQPLGWSQYMTVGYTW